MFRSLFFGILLCGAVTAARASDKPEIAPPPLWVHPTPKTADPLPAAAGAALANLIHDEQDYFDNNSEAFYVAYQTKVQRSEGLQNFSTLEFEWAPLTDRLILHHVQIRRGDEVVSLLPKNGELTIARREEKLSSDGQLNGVLTAILPVEGLQVGDVVDVAYTVIHADPILKGRVDQVSSLSNFSPVSYDRIRISWPTEAPVRWRATGGMPDPKMATLGDLTEAEVTLTDAAPQVLPSNAPIRFLHGRELAVTSYRDWNEVSASMAPLYVAAATLRPSSQLKREAAAIATNSKDPKARASAALALVEENIRYLAQTLGEGGLKPVSADDTWQRRFGDCKAKTALLLALLHELDIEAEPVLVSIQGGDGLNERLPGLSFFDHVIVRASIEGRDYWLDGTRTGDYDLSLLETPNLGGVLPLRVQGAALMVVKPPAFERAQLSSVLRLNASKGTILPAAARAEITMRGTLAVAANRSLSSMPAADRDRTERAFWRSNLDFITPSAFSTSFDTKNGELHFFMDGEAKLDWTVGGYEPHGAVIGIKLDISRDPNAINPNAPFLVNFPSFVENEETVILPNHGKNFVIAGEMVDRELAGYRLKRQASIENGIFHMSTSARSLVPEISYAEAKAAEEPMTALARSSLRLRAPANTSLSDDEVKALLEKDPMTAEEYARRGTAFFDAKRYKEAVSDYDHALDLDPKKAWIMGNRALAHFNLGEIKQALADADRAEALDPREVTTYRTRGLVAERARNWPEALANFTRSVDIAPSGFGYYHQAQAYIGLKDYDRALRAFDAELVASPTNLYPHLNKASVYVQMKQPEKARLEADIVKEISKTDDGIRSSRLAVLIQIGDRKEALAEADEVLSSQPSAGAYLQRLVVRDPTDYPNREADAKAALALDPKNVRAMRFITAYRMKAKDYVAAAMWSERAIKLAPNDPYLLLDRASAKAKLGAKDSARDDFSTFRGLAKGDPEKLNTLCWEQAIANFDLDRALEDCDAALTEAKAANALDSRGFVLFRLGRMEDAQASFNEALALSPELPASLYGRSLTERRAGNITAADADQKAAVSISPEIVQTYAEYGVTP